MFIVFLAASRAPKVRVSVNAILFVFDAQGHQWFLMTCWNKRQRGRAPKISMEV